MYVFIFIFVMVKWQTKESRVDTLVFSCEEQYGIACFAGM